MEGLRPEIDKYLIEPDYEDIITIMKECWNQDSNKRPSFDEIQKKLLNITNKSNKYLD